MDVVRARLRITQVIDYNNTSFRFAALAHVLLLPLFSGYNAVIQHLGFFCCRLLNGMYLFIPASIHVVRWANTWTIKISNF